VVHLIEFLSRSSDETMELGRKLGRVISPGHVVAMTGDLGSGKSVLARGVLEGLDVRGAMPSPTFVIVATYQGKTEVNHIDLYRVGSSAEALAMGLDEVLHSGGICVVEWADRVADLLPRSRIDVHLASTGEPDHRLIAITAASEDTGARLVGVARSLIGLGA
jgi:tRNA threonylcarbamoyladenosine biosynthesis protein TsaE